MTGTTVFLGRDGQQLGPYTPEQLAQMMAAGQILDSDVAWHEGMAQWDSAATVLQALGITPHAATVRPGPAAADPEPAVHVEPLFFTPSTLKLVLMSVCTFGIYELYWFYRNWALIKARTGQDLMPFWRAFFAPIWAYSCFKHIATEAVEKQTPAPPPPGLLALAYFILQALWRLPDAYWLISFLSFVPLLFANIAALEVNHKVAPHTPENSSFSGWNWAALIGGSLLLVLTIIGSFLPDSPA
jgi:hypothetical protein